MRAKVATAPVTLLDELQANLAHESVARRVQSLRRVTDLFLGRCVDYSDDQIALFDDVFSCLIRHVESDALALLAERLAPIPTAPPNTLRNLALHELIEVAGPPLAQSERLDDAVLIQCARGRSQQHLLAISKRLTVNEAVTDVLMERGDDDVVNSTVGNPGARFSEHGFATMVTRAEGNDSIAACVGLRRDVPRHHLLKLIAKASETVLASLAAAHPDAHKDVLFAVGEATRRARSAKQGILPKTAVSHALVRSLYDDGRLDEQQVARFANTDKFDEVTAAIACLTQVTVDLAETIMIEARIEGIFILSKVCNFSWTTVQSIIAMRSKLSNLVPSETAEHREAYARLRQTTALQVLRFHRMQQSTAAADGASPNGIIGIRNSADSAES